MKTKLNISGKAALVVFLTGILIYIPQVSLSAATISDSLISKGNGYYMERQFKRAELSYKRVIELGYESGELYFNLGNSCYKQDKLAESILYYEKALLFNPGDEDIRQNLLLANSRIIDKIESIPEFFLKRWIRQLQGIFSPNQWAVFVFLVFVLSLAGFALYALSYTVPLKKAGFTLGIILLLISCVGIVLMFSRINAMQRHNEAIIMVPSVNARSSPDEQSTNVFVLHEGTKVLLTDSVQRWKEIRIANGNKGWVPDDLLKGI